MSILQDDLEQYSAMDLDPLEGLHRPALGSPLAIGEQPSDTENEEPCDTENEERGWKEDLCHAICVNNWSDTKAILDQHPNALTAGISSPDRTALHVAAQFGNITIVKELLELLPREFLLTVDSHGDTALAMACWSTGNTQIAKCLINKNSDIVTIPNKNDVLPVTLAFASDFKEMGRYLYSVTPLECFTGRPGSKLLRFCFQAQCFDIALNLLQQREELLFLPNDIESNCIRQFIKSQH